MNRPSSHHRPTDEQAELLGQLAVELVRVRPEIQRRASAQIIISELTGGDYDPDHLRQVLLELRSTPLGVGPFGKRLVIMGGFGP